MNSRFGMVVDLNRCVGCQTCTIACKHANDIAPGVQWRSVLDVELGSFPDVERLFLVVGCQHCAEPPCVPVCPSGATFQREDGLVAMDYERCIGCGYCAVACPYQARTIVHEQRWYFGTETRQERKVEHPERRGVAQKCSFCAERIDEAQTNGRVPGVDLDVTPACAGSCIAQAIRFGDFADPRSEVSRLVATEPSVQMHAELGTDPQIRYLYQTPAVPGRDAAADAGARLDDPGNPLVGERQRFWDLRAAANFVLGGAGSGLAVAAWAMHLGGAVPARALPGLFATAAVLVTVGLFAVFMEIGRKLRFALALRRPQTSWMTREVYAAAVFYPAVLAALLWPQAAAHGLVAAAALAFLYCQARILHAARGIPAWRVALMPWMLVASGLFEGMGLLALGAAFSAWPGSAPVAVAGLVLAALNATLWHRYRRDAAEQGIGPLARAVLGRVTPWLHALGHLTPFALFALVLLWQSSAGALLGLAGAATLAGGALWKISVITGACHQQGFWLPKVPRRGSGALAAGSARAGA